MSRCMPTDSRTPAQIRASEQRERLAFVRAKFNVENNPNPQFFNGSIIRAFTMRDGSVYVEFNQLGTRYQMIISESMGNIYGYAKSILSQYEGACYSISVKGVRGRVNEKGICNIRQVTFLK